MSEEKELKPGQYNSSIRRDLDLINWKVILPQMLIYAEYQWKKLCQVGIGHLTPQDLVQEAIARAYGRGKNGTYRMPIPVKSATCSGAKRPVNPV
jgi:hypothetical protein